MLAIDAATAQFGIAACRDGRSAHWQARPARDETGRVYQHAAQVLAAVGATFADLDAVAFGCGPGSFTGVRIAAAAAQAIAFARRIPVCRVSSLAVLAAGAGRALGAQSIGACLDARMERVYLALYHVTPGRVETVRADALVDPRGFILDGGARFVAVGDGWAAYPDLLARHGSRVAAVDLQLLPAAPDLLDLALQEFRAGRTVDVRDALPEYLGLAPALPR
jgi:tRNA threonylcarbamoyladenosine biosynthesis protein TsaB